MPLPPVLEVLNQVIAADRGPREAPSAEPAFAADGMLPLAALSVEVDDLGVLGMPLAAEQAQALLAASMPARHGQGLRTVLDTRVRHTGEISADRLSLHWAAGAFATLQAQAAQALGLPRLEARLHNLLVYGPGQFFKPHQDTEKYPGMVATLVLVWPSAHLGGSLCIRQAEASHHFASQHLQATALRWCAFYADCRHEVLPVDEGWRIVLTFDLVLPQSDPASTDAAHPALVQALRELFFAQGLPRRAPWLLLLDHEYSQHGLRWPLLKGDDRARVAALRAAADALGLVPQLALAEIHQCWTANVPYHGGRGRRSAGTPEPDELIDEDLVLDYWVDADGQTQPGQSLAVSLSDCASFTETDDAFLVNEEYEGYTGNEGQTLDYWYRRAALVLQSPVAAEATRFATQPDAALADALALARQPGQHQALAQRLQLALPDLARHVEQRGRAVLATFTRLAEVLPATLAAELCQPFEWHSLKPADAKALARLARAHGPAWLVALLKGWADRSASQLRWAWTSDLASPPGGSPPGLWPEPLPEFIDAGAQAGWPEAVSEAVIDQAFAMLQVADASAGQATPARLQATWARRLGALVQLAQAVQHLPRHGVALGALLRHVGALPRAYPPRDLAPLLRALPGPAADVVPDVSAMRQQVRNALQAALQAPLQGADDFGLRGIAWTCRCADCTPAIRWAESPSAQPLVLAMAEPRRAHVQSAMQDAAAPLGFQTLRQGSPHKLVLAKRSGLHAEQQRLRAAWAADLAALDEGAPTR
jgi:2OG-Fe(II) oxygenase superfamily